MIQMILPKEIPFRISMLRQYAWWMGSTDIITVRSGIFMSRQVAFSAMLRWVSITPLLFPVVPDVNIIVQSASASGTKSNAPLFSSTSCHRDSAASSPASFCMEIRCFNFGHLSFTISITSLRISSATSTVTSARSSSSHTSSAGSAASSGTATLPLFTVPK